MKAFFSTIRDITISGILALLPLYVFFIVIAKAWRSLNSIGRGFAGMLGIESALGVVGTAAFSGLLTIGIWIVTGFLVRYSLLGTATKAAERQLLKFVPDYENYKAKAEEKLQHKVRVLPYTSALVRCQEFWQPGYIVEADLEGNYVVFLPEIPETTRGHVLLANRDQIRIVPSLTANELDTSLRKVGKGLLVEHRICSTTTQSASTGHP